MAHPVHSTIKVHRGVQRAACRAPLSSDDRRPPTDGRDDDSSDGCDCEKMIPAGMKPRLVVPGQSGVPCGDDGTKVHMVRLAACRDGPRVAGAGACPPIWTEDQELKQRALNLSEDANLLIWSRITKARAEAPNGTTGVLAAVEATPIP